jgi:uncharacterized protein
MGNTFLVAFGVFLMLEGLLPLIAPQDWRKTFKKLIDLKDGQLRFMGLMSVSGGALIVFLCK